MFERVPGTQVLHIASDDDRWLADTFVQHRKAVELAAAAF